MKTLRSYTTMKIGGGAECILNLRDLEQLSKELPRPVRMLGNGSNVLIDDRGLKGSVIVVRDYPPTEPEILDETREQLRIRVSAGLFSPTLSRWAASRGWSGVEYLVGVPGTLGGNLVQNAGANGQELKEILESATIFDLETHQKFELTADAAALDYRTSVLKEKPNWLVTSLILRLRKGDAASIQERIQKNLEYRKQKTPWTRPSLGSVFTRLPAPSDLKAKGVEWLFPGKLIEEAGLKGYRKGDAQVSEVHANYIINLGQASFMDVLGLIKEVEARVFDHSGINLHREILIWSDQD